MKHKFAVAGYLINDEKIEKIFESFHKLFQKKIFEK